MLSQRPARIVMETHELASALRLSHQLFLVTAIAIASGCSDSVHLESLSTPVFAWTHDIGNCGEVHAVDVAGSTWHGAACEGGRTELNKSGRADLAAVRAAFALLPADPGGPSRVDCSGNLHRFEIREEAGVRAWSVCGSSAGHGDVSDLVDPYKAAAESVQ